MDLSSVTDYRSAHTRSDLLLAPGEAVLAGGTWVFSEPQPATTGLVDLSGLGWPAWERRPDGGLTLAATCTIADLLAVPWAELAHPSVAPVVRACVEALVMSFKVQHVATVGGNVCLALPAGAITSMSAGLGALAVVWTADGGERRQAVSDLVTGVRTTTLAPGEVLRALELPAASLAAPCVVRRAALVSRGRSAAVVVGRSTGDRALLALTAATSRPVLLDLPLDPSPQEVEAALAPVDCWWSDPHGSLDWRRSVTALLVGQAGRELAGWGAP